MERFFHRSNKARVIYRKQIVKRKNGVMKQYKMQIPLNARNDYGCGVILKEG